MKPENLLTFGCGARVLLMTAFCAGLAGCAGASSGWQRANTSDAQRSADYDRCRAEMRSVAGSSLGVDADIAASRGADWRRTGSYDTNVASNSAADTAYAQHMVYTCMMDQGYRPR